MAPETHSLKPAAIYLRRSTDKQEQSIPDQRREILRYADEHGFKVVCEFADDGVSGTSGETRPGFLAMLDAAKAPGCAWKHVLTWDVKRLGRMDSDESGHWRWLFKRAGVEIVYTSEAFTGTSADRYIRFFKQENARDESVSLSKAVIRGLVSLAHQGWWPGGMAPYGFDLAYHDRVGQVFQVARASDSGEKLVLDAAGHLVRTVQRGVKVKASDTEHVRLTPGLPERVQVVNTIFRWYVEGLGFKSIADRLNREGIPSPKGRGWSLSTIRAMIVNETYVGRVAWNKRAMGKFYSVAGGQARERDGCGKRRLSWNARENWIVYENAHEALIDPAIFRRAQRIMKERGDLSHAARFLTGKAKVSRYLLSGLIKCGACGGAMHGRTVWKSKRRIDGNRISTSYYCCSAAIAKGKSICQPILFLQEPMDDFVTEIVADRIATLLGRTGRATLRRLVEKELGAQGHDPRPEMKRLKARLEAISKKADTVIDLTASSPDCRDLLSDRLGRLRTERREVEGRLRELEQIPVRTTDPEAVVDGILASLADARRLFEDGTLEEKKRVTRAFVECLTVVGSKRSGEIRVRKVPAAESLATGTSFESLAGAGFEPATFGL